MFLVLLWASYFYSLWLLIWKLTYLSHHFTTVSLNGQTTVHEVRILWALKLQHCLINFRVLFGISTALTNHRGRRYMYTMLKMKCSQRCTWGHRIHSNMKTFSTPIFTFDINNSYTLYLQSKLECWSKFKEAQKWTEIKMVRQVCGQMDSSATLLITR